MTYHQQGPAQFLAVTVKRTLRLALRISFFLYKKNYLYSYYLNHFKMGYKCCVPQCIWYMDVKRFATLVIYILRSIIIVFLYFSNYILLSLLLKTVFSKMLLIWPLITHLNFKISACLFKKFRINYLLTFN